MLKWMFSISPRFQIRLMHCFCVSQQIVAAILAIAGIVMMTYADGFHSHSVIGIALVVGSASTSALYKVTASLASFGSSGQSNLMCLCQCSSHITAGY